MVKKVFFILLVLIQVFAIFSNCIVVQATSADSIVGGADSFVSDGKQNAQTALNSTAINNTAGLIYNILLAIGTCIAVVIAAALGIQFITGSVEQKVKVKESLIPFVAGCIIIFGAFGIWKLVITVMR